MTHDFRNFRALTDLAPQKDYNWYTTELLRWTRPDGQESEGILFKPEDFDPGKLYPLIVYIYEKGADNLHTFIHPTASEGPLNIPWYVSHGYLVLFPELHYKTGHTGQGASEGWYRQCSFWRNDPTWTCGIWGCRD